MCIPVLACPCQPVLLGLPSPYLLRRTSKSDNGLSRRLRLRIKKPGWTSSRRSFVAAALWGASFDVHVTCRDAVLPISIIAVHTCAPLTLALLEQMMDVDPNEPTTEEKENGITKLRYMQFRESQSSSRPFGFRIEAVSGEYSSF